MIEQINDLKFLRLLHICKQTKNYKNLAVVTFMLTSNLVNKIGIKLGLKPRNHNSGEKIFEYLMVINSLFMKNLKVQIFKDTHINLIRECELLFVKSKGDISFEYIKSMIKVYYDLRELRVPNLHKRIDHDEFSSFSPVRILPFFSNNRKNRNNTSKLRPMILQKIREQEKSLRVDLSSQLTADKLENVIYLSSLKRSLSSNKKSRVQVQGVLKNNISYQNSIDNIFGYLIIGIIIILSSLGIITLLQMILFPAMIKYVSFWTPILFVGVFLLIFIYIQYFGKKSD